MPASDEGGLLNVGPESAGSDPGPVCYGLGNSRPTVTDASLVLGRINPDRPIGGKLDRLDIDAARLAIAKRDWQAIGPFNRRRCRSRVAGGECENGGCHSAGIDRTGT